MNVQNRYMAKIAVNKSLLKEYSVNGKRTVYLNDGDEFQLQFFNPYSYKVAVEIIFNGNYNYSMRKLIINPGERVWLERYLDDNKKLLFSTYFVDRGNEAVDRAISSNGDITFKFYKERFYREALWATGTSILPDCYNIKDFKLTGTTCPYTTVKYENLSNISTASVINYLATSNTLNFGSSSAGWTATATAASTDSDILGMTDSLEGQKETGRVEKGFYSDQNLANVSLNLESWHFCEEEIQILPYSEKPVTSKDLKKRYCSSCGRRLKEKFKFCPFCGAKI